MEHKSLGNEVVKGGIIHRCSCGWVSRECFSNGAASCLGMDHRDEAAAEARLKPLRNGIFDNQKEQRREAWLDGGKVGQWPAGSCADAEIIAKANGWEKWALEEIFGHHPDIPTS